MYNQKKEEKKRKKEDRPWWWWTGGTIPQRSAVQILLACGANQYCTSNESCIALKKKVD